MTIIILAVILVVIMTVVFGHGWRRCRRASSVAGELEEAATDLKELAHAVKPGEGVSVAHLTQVAQCLPAGHLRVHYLTQWAEFAEGLVKRAGGYFNALPAEEFFGDDAIVSISELGRVADAPSTLTTLGMLGTFVGISLGLIDLGTFDAASSEDLVGLLGSVVYDFGFAFVTSIAGLIGALALRHRYHVVEGALLQHAMEFRLALDRAVPRATAEAALNQQAHFLETIAEEAKESRVQLEELAGDLADALTKGLTTALGQPLARLSEAVSGQVAQAAQAGVESAKAFTDSMLDKLTEALGERLQAMADSVDRFSERFDQTQSALTGSLARVDECLTSLADRLAKEQDLLDSYRETASKFESALAAATPKLDALVALTEELEQQRHVLSGLAEGVSEAVEALHGASGTLENGVAVAADRLRGVTDALAGVHSGLQAASQQLTSDSQAWADGTTEAIESFGDAVSKSVQESLQQYDKSLATAVGSLAATIGRIEEVAEQVVDIAHESSPPGGSA